VLAVIPNVDSSTGEYRSRPQGLPSRRMGLEQEFFLVDRRGEPRDLADPFLSGCREAARAEGLDPRSFEGECAKGLVEITATSGVMDPKIEAYLDSLFAFASLYLEEPRLVAPLASSGGYETTESALFRHMPPSGTALTRDRGLSLARQACRRLEEQVDSLGRRFDATLPADRLNRGATNPRLIRSA
jgi:hypothetical protein